MQPIITVTDLVKKYGNFEAVKGISFEVQRCRQINYTRDH